MSSPAPAFGDYFDAISSLTASIQTASTLHDVLAAACQIVCGSLASEQVAITLFAAPGDEPFAEAAFPPLPDRASEDEAVGIPLGTGESRAGGWSIRFQEPGRTLTEKELRFCNCAGNLVIHAWNIFESRELSRIESHRRQLVDRLDHFTQQLQPH
jgi:hypothetical protein